ncbi:MAG: lysine--tRNA ligase [Alphaproteobacteria bacterium]|nr:lysine--tRNA ligase [Alphaproteobacteria bacterium]
MTDYTQLNAWPFEEACKLVERYKNAPPEKGYVLFETGYGPSGLPHIGTFGEVARTTMVRHAFTQMSDIPTKLFCVSDDMDGLRKVPENLPQQEMLRAHLNKPLTAVPDPFGTHESFGHHMNARLRAFLDHYGFSYEFKSSTELYKSGAFDEKLLLALARYDQIMGIMLPTLGPDRQKTYSPFLPVSPKTGNVLYVPMKRVDAAKGTIIFDDEDGEEMELPVTGGNCKLQWKPDFGMRWAALDVDFEMYGKDHLVNGKIYSEICRTLGGTPPVQFNYELFLDEKGEKISKSKGNGLTIDDWLRYAPPESLALYMYQSPKKAKKLYFDVIPRAVDDYQTYIEKFAKEEGDARLINPLWHIHSGNPPAPSGTPSFNLLMNLVSVSGAEDAALLWKFVGNVMPGAAPETHPFLDKLVHGAINYYKDFVKPTRKFRLPTEVEEQALADLVAYLESISDEATAEEMQTQIYEIGKKYFAENLKAWFSALYEALLGQPQGPRMGGFVKLYGRAASIALIRRVLAKEDLAA